MQGSGGGAAVVLDDEAFVVGKQGDDGACPWPLRLGIEAGGDLAGAGGAVGPTYQVLGSPSVMVSSIFTMSTLLCEWLIAGSCRSVSA
ncbi:hypothetical protein GCM10009722_16050 [Williamsia deligens]